MAVKTPEQIISHCAACLRDDPSFKLGSVKEQREETRLLLLGFPGSHEDMIDDIIMATLEIDAVGEDADPSETVTVSRADYAKGEWKPRSIKVTRPKSSNPRHVIEPIGVVHLVPPEILKEKKKLNPSLYKKPKQGKAGWKKEQPARVIAAQQKGLLGMFRVATGLSEINIGALLNKSRPTIQQYLTGKLFWVPDPTDVKRMLRLLNEQKSLIEDLIKELNELPTE
jgi:hypothetical protein